MMCFTNIRCSQKLTLPQCEKKLRKKLAGIKTTLYNPYLSTFRKAAQDTALGKLSDEHARTTLPPGVDTFSTEKWFNYEPSNSFIPKFSMMNLEENLQTTEEAELQAEIRSSLESAYQKTLGAFLMPIGRLIQIPTVKQISYLNFPVRLMTPELWQKWRDFHGKPAQITTTDGNNGDMSPNINSGSNVNGRIYSVGEK